MAQEEKVGKYKIAALQLMTKCEPMDLDSEKNSLENTSTPQNFPQIGVLKFLDVQTVRDRRDFLIAIWVSMKTQALRLVQELNGRTCEYKTISIVERDLCENQKCRKFVG